jgi:methionyl-tRNA formyltransferase
MSIKVCFFGTPEFALPSLEALCESSEFEVGLVVTQPDKQLGRQKRVPTTAIKNYALERDLRLIQPKSIKRIGPSFIDQLAQYGYFDVGVVVAFGQILPDFLLKFFQFGCVNVHASLLPRWRGAAPIQRALLAGDSESGVCLMQMDVGLDTGPVISQSNLIISPNSFGSEVARDLAELGAQLLVKDLPRYIQGFTSPKLQPSEGVTYAEKIQKSELELSWEQGAEQLARTIRTFSPNPAAFTFVKEFNYRVKVLAGFSLSSYSDIAEFILANELEQAESGTVLGETKKLLPSHFLDRLSADFNLKVSDSILVKASDGYLIFTYLQIASKRVASGADFLRGLNATGRSIVFGSNKDSHD